MTGKAPAKAAEREAFEEAGVRGKIAPRAIGSYGYQKFVDAAVGTVPCEVEVFPLLVKRQSETWPEKDQRETRWFDPADAYSVIGEQGLFRLIASFVSRVQRRRK